MALPLFLQASSVEHTISITTTSLTGVYFALLGTLAASIIAAITSRRASRVAARTSLSVAALSTQTARETAALSAQVSRESSGLAAQTAREIKETDYKHDFYKRIIAKRLHAWEEAEQLIPILTKTASNSEDGELIMSYCLDKQEFDNVLNRINDLMVSQVFWIGIDYATEFVALYKEHIDIRKESTIKSPGIGIAEIDDNLLRKAGKKHYAECDKINFSLLRILAEKLPTLHDVEDFFEEIKDLEVVPAPQGDSE